MLEGDINELAPHFKSLEEQLSEVVEKVWPMCVGPLLKKDGPLTLEDDITHQLVGRIIKIKTFSGRIHEQYTLAIESDDGEFFISSKIDFVLTIGDNEDVYLACECKRLNVPYPAPLRLRHYNLEYVDDGLMRFVSGQYSKGLPIAMMIGYVMDGQVGAAKARLENAFLQRAANINMLKNTDHVHSVGKPLRFSTSHLCLGGIAIDVSHTLLPWP